ncbi:MAG: tetratricopeptide repeat protein [Thermoflexia bacterium]|nr:MAG: tetratricopeptide repeat protein [Thermoflexia bacterium]
MYAKQGRLKEARRELDAALPRLSEKAAAYHNRGIVAYQLGDSEGAFSDLQAAIQEDPEDHRSHY